MKILALGAHLDDIELGCGATLAKLRKEGNEIRYLGFSPCDIAELQSECQCACRVLGLSDIHIYSIPVRKFPEHRQEILDILIKVRDKYVPDHVFTHSSFSIHQDHRVVHEETIRAFRYSPVFGYEQPWDNLTSDLKTRSEISSEHLELKISALQQYKSQEAKHYFDPDFIRGLAKVRGVQFNCTLAEAFETIKNHV